MKLLFEQKEIDRRVKELAKILDNEIKGKENETVMLYIEKGGKPFFEKLLNAMTVKPITDSIWVKSYVGDKSSGDIRWIKKPSVDLKGKRCIIVDDILDTGKTIKKVKEFMLEKGATDCKICVAVNKHERREENIEPDYYLFDLDKGFLVGFGMDYNEKYRDLPSIYIMGES